MNEAARGRRRTILGLVAVGFIGAVAAAGVLEAALRILDLPAEQPVGWAWRGDPSEGNEVGFRGHRGTSAQADVVLVCDSQVETERVPFARMPEVLLSSALRELTGRDIRVMSVAAGGWGQDQQLLALRRALPAIRPRAVVLWFTPGNDLWNNTFPTHMPADGWPKPTFWLEGDDLRGPHAEWGTAYRPPVPRLFRAWRRILGRPMYVTDAEWEPRLPPAYRAARAPAEGVRSLAEFGATELGLSVPEMAAALAGENLENEKAHVGIALTPRSPRLEYSVRLTRRLLAEIARLCGRHGASFLVLAIDTAPHHVLPREPTRFEVAGRVVTLSKAAEDALVRAVLADVPHVVLSGYRPEFRTSKLDAHLTDEGNRHFMGELARRLVSTGASR